MSRYGVKEMFSTLQGEGGRAGCRSVFIRLTGCSVWSGQPHHRERDSEKGLCALWCDTEFTKGRPLDLDELIEAANGLWVPEEAVAGRRWVVLTGGEPALQINSDLVNGLHSAGWSVAVETNGNVVCPALVLCDHVCVSPKLLPSGSPWPFIWDHLGGAIHEVKVVLPGGPAAGDSTTRALANKALMKHQGWTADELHEIEATAGAAGVDLFVQPQDVLLDSATDHTALKPSSDKALDEERAQEAADTYRRHLDLTLAWIMRNPVWRLSLQQHKHLGLPLSRGRVGE